MIRVCEQKMGLSLLNSPFFGVCPGSTDKKGPRNRKRFRGPSRLYHIAGDYYSHGHLFCVQGLCLLTPTADAVVFIAGLIICYVVRIITSALFKSAKP